MGDVFEFTPATTGEEFVAFIRGMIEECGEENPPYSFRVLPYASKTTVFQKSFFVLSKNERIPMKLVFTSRDIYVVSWAIAPTQPPSPGYVIFDDLREKFVERLKLRNETNFGRMSIKQARDKKRRGGKGQQPSVEIKDSHYLLQEMATAKKLGLTSDYVFLTRIARAAGYETVLGKFNLIKAFECLYNAGTEKDRNKLAGHTMTVLQMFPEPMRNAKLLNFIFSNFENGAKPPKTLVEKQQDWSSNSKKCHQLPEDTTSLTQEQRELSEEWTLILPKTEEYCDH